jgi:hypothetical protein
VGWWCTNELRVSRVVNVNNMKSASTGLCSDSIEISRLLIDDNVVRGSKLFIDSGRGESLNRMNSSAIAIGRGAIFLGEGCQFMKIEHLHAMVLGLRSNVNMSLEDFHISPAGSNSLGG